MFSAFTNLVAFTSYYDEDEEKVDSEDNDDDGRQRNPLALLAQIISKALVILYSGVLAEYNDSFITALLYHLHPSSTERGKSVKTFRKKITIS